MRVARLNMSALREDMTAAGGAIVYEPHSDTFTGSNCFWVVIMFTEGELSPTDNRQLLSFCVLYRPWFR